MVLTSSGPVATSRPPRCSRLVAATLVLSLLALSPVRPAAAMPAPILVTTTMDIVAEDGLCSLREAMATAESQTPPAAPGECSTGSAGEDLITLAGSGTYLLVSPLNTISDYPLTIEGNGAVIDGAGTGTIVTTYQDLLLVDLTLTNGNGDTTATPGGAIFASGGATVTLDDVAISNNQSRDGGITVWGATLRVTNGSSIDNNTATQFGGGGINVSNLSDDQGKLEVFDSTIESNTSFGGVGGGVRAHPGTRMIVERSTFRANTQNLSFGGGIWNEGELTLTAATLVDNTEGLSNRGTATVTDTVFLDNGVAVTNQAGTFTGTRLTIEGHDLGFRFGQVELANSLLVDNLVAIDVESLVLMSSTVSSSGSGNSWGVVLGETSNASIMNSTISGEEDFFPIRLFGQASATVVSSTLFGSSVAQDQSTLRAAASIFEQPVSSNFKAVWIADSATVTSDGFNVVGSTTDPTLFVPTDHVFDGPFFVTSELGRSGLLPLAINDGGTLPTHSLLPSSQARDFVQSTALGGQVLPIVDQNGTPRPIGMFADAGAHEAAALPVVFCNGKQVTWFLGLGDPDNASEGDDVILGTPGDDFVAGRGGDDTMCGLDGDDTLIGNEGNDFLLGGAGDDILHGNEGNDRIRGQQGEDIIVGSQGNDFLYGGIGADRIFGREGADTIGGFGGDDTIDAGPGDDRVFGGFGADFITAGAGDDRVSGLIGNDVLHGGTGNDVLNGGNGNDELVGDAVDGGGDDVLNGGNGNDELYGDDGDDVLNGGKADDFLSGGPGTDTCNGNLGTDSTDNCEKRFGIP